MLKTSAQGYLNSVQDHFQNHVCVLPCGGISEHAVINWTTTDLQYYVSYIINGNPADTMFNGFIFYPVSVRKNHFIHPKYAAFGNIGDQSDWQEWINVLFQPGQNLHALHTLTSRKLDLWITIPYPHLNALNFGSVHGKMLQFNSTEDRFTAVKWWIDEFLLRWNAFGTLQDKLSLKGFVWQRESVFDFDVDLVKETNRYIKSKGFFRMWLPFYGASMCTKWSELDFDAVNLHPNYYSNSTYNVNWLEYCSIFSKKLHTGLQIVGGKGYLYKDTDLLDYFNFGLPERFNYMNESFLVYQFPQLTLKEMYEQRLPDYIRLYMFIKGIYTKVNYPGMPYV